MHALAAAFADVEEQYIPGPCDGLTVGLHSARARPLILVEPGRTRRLRFTLAHEIGHIVIPWHTGGTYVCQTGRWFDQDYHAAASEAEANRFAGHLLVPEGWLAELLAERGHLLVGPLLEAMYSAEVSPQVACLRLRDGLPAGHVFAVIDAASTVLLSGQTDGTGIAPPRRGAPLDPQLLDQFAAQKEELRFGSRRVIWWGFRGSGGLSEEVEEEDERTAREILDAILARHVAPDEESFFRQSLGGVIGAENSEARREGASDRDSLYFRFRGRFARERNYPRALLQDPELDTWIRKRAEDLGRDD